jgi:fructose-1,6-bisphosphatase-3
MQDALATPDLKYLELLSAQYPTQQDVLSELINLEAILGLPKGTEHFISDVHGEYGAFAHILNNCSGVVRERVRQWLGEELTQAEQDELCTLIYYPREKVAMVEAEGRATEEWYRVALAYLVRIAQHLSEGYSRSKVRKALPPAYAYIIDELLHISRAEPEARATYHERIIRSILSTGSTLDFIEALTNLIKRLAVDKLHFVGDVFDRGEHPDLILDRMMSYHTIDLQWGNHDILWMGAAAGSAACIATVVRNNVRYQAYDVLESAYGISMRELALFAEKYYEDQDGLTAIEKAIDIIMLKLEGQLILRHPEMEMDERLLLGCIDPAAGTVTVEGRTWDLSFKDLPTLDPANPYALTQEERHVVDELKRAFASSQRLQRHIRFMYDKGAMYTTTNNNLLFHACIPLYLYGQFRPVAVGRRRLTGRAFMDWCDRIARVAYSEGTQDALDWMYYLWCGRYSPLCGRTMKTFERIFIPDKTMWEEPQDAYYELTKSPQVCRAILSEFGIDPERGHIINGHTPVKAIKGETPIKSDGKLLVIDGGFCHAYHKKTGIAGYTLIADTSGMRIKAHRPFTCLEDVLDLNADIMSETDRFEVEPRPLLVEDTDDGTTIRAKISDLRALLVAYRQGMLKERPTF